jgi:hypothetical protein
MVNSGSHNSTVAQSYMTFTSSVLQIVDPVQSGCVTTTTVTPDLTTFDTVLQNEQCDGPNPCVFRGNPVNAGSFAFASGAFSNPPGQGDFRVAQVTFCAVSAGDALLHWQFNPPDPVERDCEITDSDNNIISNRALYTDYVVHVVNSQALVGHVTWQGRPAQPSSLQQLPITVTLRLASGGPDNEYTDLTTDAGGVFTLPLGSLPTGTYNWRVKGPDATPNTNTAPGFLANAGNLTLTSGTTNTEMGLMKAGDANNDNVVNATDFAILKNAFGKSGCPSPQPGYDNRADFTGDCVVNSIDFSLLRSNFGIAGAGPVGP